MNLYETAENHLTGVGAHRPLAMQYRYTLRNADRTTATGRRVDKFYGCARTNGGMEEKVPGSGGGPTTTIHWKKWFYIAGSISGILTALYIVIELLSKVG